MSSALEARLRVFSMLMGDRDWRNGTARALDTMVICDNDLSFNIHADFIAEVAPRLADHVRPTRSRVIRAVCRYS